MGYFIGEGVPLFDNRTAFWLTDMLIGTPALGKAYYARKAALPAQSARAR